MSDVINTDNLCMGCMSILESPNSPCAKCSFEINNYNQSMHQLRPYTILCGKYLIGRVLGEGGFGITYLGWDLNLDIRIAVKEYYPSGLVTREITSTGTSTVVPFSGDKREIYQSSLDKFVNEAKSLAKFYTLPGIVSVKDFFRENGTAYIVMEFVDGITLKQHLANNGGKLGSDDVFELMRTLMKSLSKIHAQGIIHRDISPDNIMLTREGDVKLLDFGAARSFASEGNRSMSVFLKPGYAPEEQYRTKGRQGPWTDVYALCASIYRMITGITPPEALERYKNDGLVRPSQMGITILPRLESALLKGLAVFQEDRYQSIDELYNDIYETAQPEKAELLHMDPKPEEKADNNVPPVSLEQDLNTESIKSRPSEDKITEISQTDSKKSKIKKLGPALWITCAVFAAAAIIIAAIVSRPGGNAKNVSEDLPEYEVTSVPGSANPDNIESQQGDSNTLSGNTLGNICNIGLAAQKDDWIYYVNSSDNNYLYKIHTDGTENTRLSSDNCEDINVVDNWIYYTNVNESHSLYKVFADGTQRTRITGDSCYYINVAGEWIYYQNDGDYCSIYKIRTDGTQKTRINDDSSYNINAAGGWIYYINDSDNSCLYKIRIDGTEKTKINDDKSYGNILIGDWIYFINSSDNYKIYKIRTDGTEKSMVNNDGCNYINAAGDWIYYTNMGNNGYIYKIRIDGTEKTKINNQYSRRINLAGDWIYYFNAADNNSVYRIHTDGTGNQKAGQADTTVQQSDDNTLTGNTSGNINNFGTVVQKGDWIYYTDHSDNGYLYKIRTDGTQETRLNSDKSSEINVVGDWIYYQNSSDFSNLYKIRTDGTGRTMLNKDGSYQINAVGDWIYYSNSSENYKLYKIRTDGTERTRLNKDICHCINVVGDWIYYNNLSDNDRIYKIRTDGKQRTRVNSDDSFDVNVVGDWIYYSNFDDNDYIYRIRTDGKQRTRLNKDKSDEVNVAGDWVYYINDSDNSYIYKIRTDGTGRIKINSDESHNINIAGDWIYYNFNTYRIHTDGTGNEEVR